MSPWRDYSGSPATGAFVSSDHENAPFHFDGKVLQLDEPADLPVNQPLEVEVCAVAPEVPGENPLQRLARLARELPNDPDWPADGAVQHDHYLYGPPKRP